MKPRAILLLAALSLWTAAAARSQQPTAEDINHSRGLEVSSAYHLDNLDAINLFSGGLTVSVPLGIEYPVGGGLSYRFSVHTNSNVWDFDRVIRGDGVFETVAEPDTQISNAGLGWTLTFGRLFPPNTPGINDNPSTWLLLEGDGGRRKFSSALHSWGSSATTTFSYTRDGSYLRMHKLANGEREVESPDGTVRVFRTDGWLRQIRDRFGNALNITYDLNFLTWTLTDSTGRSHVATFEADPTDPELILAKKRKQLKTLDLAAFNNTRATYTFQYSRVFLDRPSKDSSATTGPTVEVSLLDSITLPDTSTFQVATIRTAADKRNTFEESGMIRALTLPTLGTLEWEYFLYTFPETEPGGVEEGPTPWSTGSGVRFKRLINNQGTTVGTWTYQRGDRPPTQPAAPPITTEGAFEVRTWVTDPLGHQTVNYFQNHPADFGYGLPYTKLLGDGTRLLSREVFDGAVSAGSRKRSVYLLYEADDPAAGGGNERVAKERTIYHDDADRFADVSFSSFDGLGHYRTATTGGNFGTGDVKTTFTNYNPNQGTFGQPGYFEFPTFSAWVLETFTEQTATEAGVTAKQQFCFEAATGFLQRVRVYKATSPGSTDVLRVYTRNSSGQLTREQHYGGDLQSVSTSTNLCSLAPPAADLYLIDHTYQNGALATSQYKTSSGGNLGFFHVNQTIDLNTGLAAASTDTAGLITDFEYDALGRPTWIKPRATGGVTRDGWTEFAYPKVSLTSRPQVKIRQRGTGAKTRPILAESRTILDEFGRVTNERTTLPTGQENLRLTLYNGLGLKKSVSELAIAGSALHQTVFNNYDPFGRPRQIVAPDGKIVTLIYNGKRVKRRVVSIGTSRNATTGAILESSVTTFQRFDRQGRLDRIVEDEGGASSQTTDYFFDVGDRLARVKQVRAGVTQERLFNYDQRGFLLSERHPESGATGNGLIEYFDYDPLGHAGRRSDDANSLTFTYDRAERLTQIRQTLQPQRVQKEFTYATASGFSDKRAGKLISATRHNYFDDFGVDLAITENYTYGGREGRMSVKGTVVSSGDSYTQGFSWNELGDPESLTYPDCLHCPLGVEPARTVSYSYTNGFLTSVPGWATGITYHPNGMISEISLQNGTAWTQGRDPDDMRRPASITVAKGTSTYFATGTYQYDGSGSVVKMGSDYFLYDRLNRLVEGTAFQSGGSRRQTYAFDGFGNLTDITTWAFGSPTPRSVATNPGTNRLSAAGYDAAGAMTSWGAYTYERDPLGMIGALKGGGLDLRYAYTADDERFLEFDVNIFGSVWRLRDLGGQVIREIHLDNRAGTWSWQKDWIRREGQPLATVDALEGTRYLHADHLGTTRAITNGAGNLTTSFHFFPFGELAAKLGSSTEVMQFTGHARDDHILAGGFGTTDDLDYMHARYYNPQLGRFLRVDPSDAGDQTKPASWNRYGYAAASPIVFYDPDGQATETALYLLEVSPLEIPAPPPVLLVGASFVGGVLAGRFIGETEIGGRTVDSRISDALADLILLMSKRKGRVIPTDLEPLADDQLQKALKEERAKGREKDNKRIKDLERALKERRLRNKDKARGGRKEPKKPKRLREEESVNRIDDVRNEPVVIP